MREVTGSTPGLDFYLLCEPICVSLHLLKPALLYGSVVCCFLIQYMEMFCQCYNVYAA
jgi:hypothetical protein